MYCVKTSCFASEAGEEMQFEDRLPGAAELQDLGCSISFPRTKLCGFIWSCLIAEMDQRERSQLQPNKFGAQAGGKASCPLKGRSRPCYSSGFLMVPASGAEKCTPTLLHQPDLDQWPVARSKAEPGKYLNCYFWWRGGRISSLLTALLRLKTYQKAPADLHTQFSSSSQILQCPFLIKQLLLDRSAGAMWCTKQSPPSHGSPSTDSGACHGAMEEKHGWGSRFTVCVCK